MAGNRLGLGALHHVGMVVPDCAAAVDRYAGELGLGPVHRFEDRYHVQVGPAQRDIGFRGAFVRLGATLLELLEPLDDRSPQADWLGAHPGGGLHHLAYRVDSLAEVRALVRDGSLELRIDAALSPEASRWVYVEDPAAGMVLEVVERGPGSDAFFGRVERDLGPPARPAPPARPQAGDESSRSARSADTPSIPGPA